MKPASLIIFGIGLLFAPSCLSQGPIQPASVPVEQHPSPIDLMKKTVVFLQAVCNEKDATGNLVERGYAGTAFLLSVPDSRLNDRSFTYLVTNRHVAQPGIEANSPCSPTKYYLRVDLKQPDANGSYSKTAELPPSALAWTFPQDPSVDLAISPIGLDSTKVDLTFLPVGLLMGDSDIKKDRVEEGDSVLFTGLFIQLVGQTHSEPIVREGKIAMMPREKVQTTLRTLGDIYLVDCHVFGGNSGSPMFIDLAGERGGSLMVGTNYKLLGVVSGYVKETENFELQTVASYAGTMDANSGVAVIVPAQKLLDLVDAPNLKQAREAAIASLPK